jgi:hypothetical protein
LLNHQKCFLNFREFPDTALRHIAAADSAASKRTLVALDECVAAQVAQLERLLAVVLETLSGLAALPRHSPNLIDIHQVHVQLHNKLRLKKNCSQCCGCIGSMRIRIPHYRLMWNCGSGSRDMISKNCTELWIWIGIQVMPLRIGINQCCGSGMVKKSGSGMNIQDHISESLGNNFLGSKYLNSLMRIRIRDLFDPGSGIQDEIIRIQDEHHGSATLISIL